MINISEKDGAVIIVIEDASRKEKQLIEEAKALVPSPIAWGKFKCNQNKQSSEAAKYDIPVDKDGYVDLSSFEDIIGGDIPF